MKNTELNSQLISVIMPTFRRPEGLKIALESLMAQTNLPCPIEIIVTDNDPKGSAKAYLTKAAKDYPGALTYIHVPHPGVSNARNGAIKIAKGRYIAWLDDDQEADPNWIHHMYDAAKAHEAGLVFCKTFARIPGESKFDEEYERFFERMGPDAQYSEDSFVIEPYFGCGNSFMDRQLCTLPAPVFDPKTNETGGEDDILFEYIIKKGITIAWSKLALVHEDIRPHRVAPAYIKTRSFAFGQSPSELAFEESDPIGVMKWMCIGLAQIIIYLPLTLISRVTGHTNYIKHLSKLYQGYGKIFWFGRFKPKLYGQAVVANKAF